MTASDRILLAMCLVALGREVFGLSLAVDPSHICLLLFYALQWHSLNTYIRRLLTIAALLALSLYLAGRLEMAHLRLALDRATFFSLFIIALGSLREAASLSRLVRNCGNMLVRQPPARRYTLLTLGGHLCGVLLNMGAINLFGSIIDRATPDRNTPFTPKARRLKRKRMTLAVLRGFCGTPLWSPTSITVAVVLASIPTLDWLQLLPFGIAATLAFLAVGAVIDFAAGPKQLSAASTALFADGNRQLMVLVPLAGMVLLIGASAYSVSSFSGLPMIVALTLCVPAIAFTWISLHFTSRRGPAAVILAARRLRRRGSNILSGQRNEMSAFACAAIVGTLLIQWIDMDLLEAFVSDFGISPANALILATWLITLSGVAGVSPMISVSALAGVFHQSPMLAIDPLILGLTMMTSWAIVAGLSPVTASVQLSSRCVGEAAVTVGLVWNGAFSLCTLLLLDLVILLVL